MTIQNVEMDYAKKMQICPKYVEALEDEQKKIQVFRRELPLCLELVTQAIEACRKELSGTSTTSDECSEQTSGPAFEEFMPIKKSSLSDEEGEQHDSPEAENNKKSDWLRSVQLWNPIQDPNPNQERVAKKAKVIEVKPNVGAFQPFKKEIKRDLVTDLQPTVKVASSTSSSSTETNGGCKSDSVKASEEQIQQQQSQTQTHRKQRRCWSPELHRRFLNALQLLGGSHVATPKQIRDHMKVDGLTNDEVKSHLQKYRIHTRRPTTSSNGNSQQPQFVVVGGIWVPSPLSDIANNNGLYAPTTVQPQQKSPESPKDSVERISGRCNSPVSSSSTNTTTTSSPVS